MKKTQLTYGLLILIPLLLSTLFIGLNSITNADQKDGLDLNQSEVGVHSGTLIFLYLKLQGTDIEGDSPITSMDRENSIQLWSFRHDLSTAREASTGMQTGMRQHSPIVIAKQIDRSSPLLFKGLANNELAEAEFRFFRPNPVGDGTTQWFYTIKIEEGRISSIRTFTLTNLGGIVLYMEEVSFVFGRITWTWEPTGAEHLDDWREA
ncbi:MAG: type VI secretion system tube protein TssD [Candidatus Kariarchaeaceae archaeon]|jgi:type VI secretion system secreted protein Hcp